MAVAPLKDSQDGRGTHLLLLGLLLSFLCFIGALRPIFIPGVSLKIEILCLYIETYEDCTLGDTSTLWPKKNKQMPGKKVLMMVILGERKRSQYLPAAKTELGEVVASCKACCKLMKLQLFAPGSEGGERREEEGSCQV